MKFYMNLKSGNEKTGAMPVSISSKETCPDSCPLKDNGCYATYGPLAWHWSEVTKEVKGVDYDDFLRAVRSISKGALWRHNQSGDLAGENETLDVKKLERLVTANKGRRGFTFTHKKLDTQQEKDAVRDANNRGFTINLSANNLHHADKLTEMGIAPVAVALPKGASKKNRTPAGRLVVTCPATNTKKVTCLTCGICAKPNRDYLIGFPAHGTGASKADIIARGVDA
jgi:hypothetical protein